MLSNVPKFGIFEALAAIVFSPSVDMSERGEEAAAGCSPPVNGRMAVLAGGHNTPSGRRHPCMDDADRAKGRASRTSSLNWVGKEDLHVGVVAAADRLGGDGGWVGGPTYARRAAGPRAVATNSQAAGAGSMRPRWRRRGSAPFKLASFVTCDIALV
ncbi:hypothetical protein CPLU01_06321 [Colletotrichum plurivorum]|uniref:Uncharacterized protein n=1 Tax=Colletotrichum plurivorum TaxID=2175906 RepID=A0A8H6KIQ8_9PEZI|nr:hypothetical protein CPLU01_06321 [Colletotrichum plurivorum]